MIKFRKVPRKNKIRFSNCLHYAIQSSTHRLMWVHLQDIGKEKYKNCEWIYKDFQIMSNNFGSDTSGETFVNTSLPVKYLISLL